MVLVPIVALCMLYGHPGWALATFLVAALTDLLDGLIARWIGQQTTLGAWLDPMADKLLLLTVFVILTLPGFGLTHRLPVWLTVLVISRDVGIVLTVAVINLAVAPRTFSPSPLGKLATATFLVTGCATLYANYGSVPQGVLDALVYASLAVTLASAADYLRRVMRPATP
ncbi:MAG: CDP-alcohol phosphatidyltransferase family protein [Acidimicrobiia bacterium]|nr:CDP-alcohol phosphatidyltransferase family protein [Acidimicrobiia bacterium]